MDWWHRSDNAARLAITIAGLLLPACGGDPCLDPQGHVCSLTWQYRQESGAPLAGIRIDLDNDGLDEVAVVSKYGDTLSLAFAARGPTTIYDVGKPTALAGVDIDSDGLDDLFVAGSLPAQLLPFYSNGDGSLVRGLPLPLERPMLDLVARDLNGDGAPELIGVDGEHLVVMDVEGTAQRFAAGSSPIELELGDLDSDGQLDIVVLDLDGSLVSLLGDGAGSFTASASLPAEPGTRDLELRDLDGDERLDALLRDRLRGGLTFAAGDGAGGFAPARAVELSDDSVSGAGLLAGPFNASSGLASVTLAVGSLRTWFYGSSFTHAGFLDRPAGDNARFDLIGQGFVAGERSVALIAPQTGPAPIIIGETVLSHRAMGLSSADFNGDGLGDLAVAHVDCKVSILDGLGDISFADALPGPAFDLCPTTLRAADVDHDGDVDLLGHHDSVGIQLALGDGLGGFTVSTLLAVSSTSFVGILDGDPRALIVLRGRDNELLPLAVDPAGQLHPQVTFALADGQPSGVGDLDGDGDDELLIPGTGSVQVLRRAGNELVIARKHVLKDVSAVFSGEERPELTVGDYDGDGVDEVLLREDDLFVVVDELHSADPQVLSSDRIDGVPTWASLNAAADFDGDGHLDHGVFQLQGDFTYVRGDGLGFSGPPYAVRIGWPHAITDLDGNGRADLLVSPQYNLERSVFRAEAREVTLPGVEDERQLSVEWDFASLTIVDGDLDGDGLLDIVISDKDSISTLWGDNEGFHTRTTRWSWSFDGQPILASDLNGDGLDEVIVADASSSFLRTVGWGRDDHTRHTGQINLAHGFPQAAAAGDFDGDGLVDVAVAWGPGGEDPTMGVAVFYGEALADGDWSGSLNFSAPQVLLSLSHPDAALLSGQEDEELEEELPTLALQAADIDGDGRPDLLLDSDVEGTLRILWNDGSREFTTADLPGRSALLLEPGVVLTIGGESLARHNVYGRRIGPAIAITSVGSRRLDAVTECNGDGVADLRLRGSSVDPRFMIGIDSTFVEYPLASAYEERSRCTDVNGDGVPDLIDVGPTSTRLVISGRDG